MAILTFAPVSPQAFTFVLFGPAKTISHDNHTFLCLVRLFNLWRKSAGIKDKSTAASGSACGSLCSQRSWQIYILPVVSWPRVLFISMGINCTSQYFPQSFHEPSPLSSKLYKPFPRKKRCIRGAVVMQLTGEGLASSNPPRYMNELVSSVRYHYQYQCLFAAQDDSVLIYGEKKRIKRFTIFKHADIIRWIDNITVMLFSSLSSNISSMWYIF